MTNIPALATLALTTLTPFLVKGGEAIASGIGKDLWGLIKKPFIKDRDKKLLEKLEENPEDAGTQGAVTHQLEGFLEDNPELAAALAELVNKPETQELAQQISVFNSENVVIGSDLKAGGDIIIGGSKDSDPKS